MTDILKIATKIAGPTNVMLKDMGYYEDDIGQMLKRAEDNLISKNMNIEEASRLVGQVLIDSVQKVVPDISGDVKATISQSENPRDGWHEVAHKLLNPAFDLKSGDDVHAHKHHPVEIAMEEAFTAGMEGRPDGLNPSALSSSIPYLIGDSVTIGEAMDNIGKAPISTKERKQIRNVALHETRAKLRGHESKKLNEKADLEEKISRHVLPKAPWSWQLMSIFLESVIKRTDDRKSIMSDEMETKMRQLALRLKSNLQKLIQTHS